MGLIKSTKNCFINYANFDGRASRTEFWYFNLFILLSATSSAAIDCLTAETIGLPVFTPTLFLVTFLPYCAVYQRRIQDIGTDGLILKWWIWPIVLGVFKTISKAGASEHNDFKSAIIAALLFLMSIYILVMLCKKGAKGPNRFGDEPPKTE